MASQSQTYTTLATLRSTLTTTKQKERRLAAKELLDLLSDSSTLKKLTWEAQHTFDSTRRRSGETVTFPKERVDVLYRSLLDASILAANKSITGEGGRQRKQANGTGYIKQSTKFTAEDVLFPHKVFLRMDGPQLEYCDGGYAGNIAREEDWKTRPRYGFHLDTSLHHSGYSAMYYVPTPPEEGRTRLSSKEILGSVNYCISCLNDDYCVDMAEVELMQWLAHICARPDYVAVLPVQAEVSYILAEVSSRIYREFDDGRGERLAGSFAGLNSNNGHLRRRKEPMQQECLVASAKCLCGLVFNCTTRLGIGMHLYLRPIVEMVAWWAENAWAFQTGGLSTANASTQSAQRMNLRTEGDIAALLPYLYSSVTHLLAAHPEQSVQVLSEHGHALLRLARKNYLKSATNPQMRDALTEYLGAHILVAETSGKLYGLPEGDVGPLVPELPEEYGDENMKDKKVQSSSATLDKKVIDSLLEIVRNEKVWQSLFSSSGGDQDAMAKKSRPLKTHQSRKTQSGSKKSISVEGGGRWNPLNRKQRRYLELVSRLLRLSQRFHLAEAEAFGDGTADPLDSLVDEALKMTQQGSDIEKGEIDVDTSINSTAATDSDLKHVATAEALAGTPWVKMICQHLYKLNPKLQASASLVKDASTTQSTLDATSSGDEKLFTQSTKAIGCRDKNDQMSQEQCLLQSCPILRALVCEDASTTVDSIRPTTTATLQIICASAESFPRGECWASSTRKYWTTTLDETAYPGGASACVRERNGSSPVDAASVVYLLGTTLESCGSSGGDDDVQVWTLMALLKMAESSAIICTREGLRSVSFEALRVVWQFVWRTLLRYDLRYSSYTSGAYAGNAGELVLQLLTQIVRYQCTDQMCLPLGNLGSSPFIQEHSKEVWKLPCFEKVGSVLSGTCFELATAVVQHANIADNAGISMESFLEVSDATNASATRDRKWLISFCLRFIEHSLTEDKTQSMVQRSFLPFASICLASLVSNGGVVEQASTFELNNLMIYSTTEDTEPVCMGKGHENDALNCDASINQLCDILSSKSLFPYINPGEHGHLGLLGRRILQDRGALLVRYSDAVQERQRLSCSTNTKSLPFAHKRVLGDAAVEKVKTMLDELLFGLRYGSDGENESGEEEVTSKRKKASEAPRITGCLSLLLTILLSSHESVDDAAKLIADISATIITRVLDYLPDVIKLFILEPPDLLAIINHLDGIARVLTHIAAASSGTSTSIPSMLKDSFKDIYAMCKSLLRNHRHSMYASNLSPIETSKPEQRRMLDYDSDDVDRQTMSQMASKRFTQKSQFSDDSDGFMDDAEDGGPSRRLARPPPKRTVPPPKRRRMENTSIPATQNQSVDTSKAIDLQSAWATTSLMIVLKPSIESLELISGHLVWPEDSDNEDGYSPVSKSIDPRGAVVCASLFCQKSAIQRQHFISLQPSNRWADEDDQQSAIVLCVEVVLHARRHASPASKYFMWGLGILTDLIELGDRSEGHFTIGASESKLIIDALYPEGASQDNEDYRVIRHWKKALKFRSLYRADQLCTSTLAFLRGQDNIHKSLDDIFVDYFIKSSFRRIDEGIRAHACDALGVALGGFGEQKMIVSEMFRSILPPLKSEKKFRRWTDSLSDPKMSPELSQLEESALNDARLSFEFHCIDCIGLIAGSTTDEAVCVDMVWKLIDLNAYEPAMGLLSRRACERAALMLGFKKVNDLFSDMAPHLLVKWIESRRSLKEFPLLLSSPFALQGACRYLPNEVLDMLVTEGGWDDKLWNFESLATNFTQSSADILVPVILLNEQPDVALEEDKDNAINSSRLLSDLVLILLDSTSDETFAKILRHHISDIFGYVLVLQSDSENAGIQSACDVAFKHLTGRISEVHIERDGAKQAFVILRRILKLHAVGISVVNQDVHLTPSSFVEGMKRVSQHINQQSNCGFLESVGSSLTELFILAGFWLSCNGTSVRQREKFFKPISLLSNILNDLLREATIKPQELGFCFNFFISSSLDPKNHLICPDLLECLQGSLRVLFLQTKDVSLVEKVMSIIHNLCLGLLAIHKRSFVHFVEKCNLSLSSAEYTKKYSLGLLANTKEIDCVWVDSSYLYRDDMLKEFIKSKASLEEKTSSDIMIGAYDCLDVIVNSGKVSLDDILGAEDIVTHEDTRRRVFGDVNEKYEVDSLFDSMERTEQKRSLRDESLHFIQLMEQYPIADNTIFHSQSQLPDVLSVDALARLLALQRLEKTITAQKSSSSDALDIPNGVLRSLISVCQSKEDSNEAKVISSRCLGDLACRAFISSVSSESPRQNTSEDDPLQRIKTRALSMVGKFILSGSPEISLIAMKTAKSLLSLADGKECLSLLDDEQVKGVLVPFVTGNGSLQKEQVVLSSNFMDSLKMIGGSNEVDGSWCWNEDLWTCFASSEVGSGSDGSYWIKNIVSAMISCCLGKTSKHQKSIFIRACLGLCAKEASFSSCLFPGIIFFLLESQDRYQYERSKSSTRDLILSETAVGSPTSEMNIFITQCFSRILDTSTSDGSKVFVGASYAVSVVLDTLDMLHSITKNRFLSSSSHVKNSSDLPKQYSTTNKKSRKSSAAVETSDFPPPPKWRGVPYGVVLGLDGLKVAMACMRSKKYYSAIYYCEMAMQNFSGVGNFLEQIANDSIPNRSEALVGDISGFGVEQEQKRSLLDLALLAKDILVGCLSELQHKEELQGVLSQASALSLKQNIMNLEPVQECHNDQALPMLLDLDVELQNRNDELAISASSGIARVTSCLEDLGLEHVKQHYIKGIGSAENEFREKWFEDALNKASQWDDTLLPQSDDVLHSSLSSEGVASINPSKAPTNATLTALPWMTPDYYESVYRSLQSFVKHDTAGALASIANARQTVLSGIGLLEGSESTSRSMSNHISKLNVLSSLSVLGETLDGKVSLQNVLHHWGFADEAGIKDFKSLLLSFDEASLDIREQPIAVDSARFRSLRIDLSTKEVLLKILLRRFPQDRDMISQAIASHIYSSCRIYRDIGRPDVARQTLSRMRNLLQVVQSQEMPNQSSIPLMLRLEDAKVMARQLDFDNAITHCKTIVNHLSNAKNLDADFNNVLVRALLLGGCLMAHEHVDAIGTMESFFDRAAKLSHRAHEEDSDPSSLIHATTSYFKLGEFASGIYSSVNARVASEAWKQRKANQIEREKEVAAMQNECAQLEKKYKRSKKQVDVDAFNVASHKLSTLSKEVDLDGREIRNTQDSLKKYLGMAVESHCNALKLCPTTATSIDKHVFKLIGLWFENCQKPDTHNIVNDLLKSNACLIPTYHFVPLIYQIFSRIDENDSSGCFQSTLHKLVVNICAEHPYHGIPQLIALSNSNLANKVEAAKIIIQQLRKNAPSYVSGLIDSYGCLMDSYIDLANLDTNPIPKKQTKGFTFSKYKLKLDGCLSGGRRGSKNLSLSNVPAIISKPPAIRPDGQYGNGCDDPIGTERVVGFESTFELAPSGLHRPAIVICLGSQGGRFKQLVKGDDDLRQDAVMQQVFGTMNNLLKNEGIPGANHMTTAQNSPRQQLKIVTYGITPLSPTTGVLEWVDNTEAFGSFMKSSSNNVDASSRYYPGEWGNTACSALYSADHERKSQEERRRDFDIVCRNHSPVFRFFFIENFAASMEAWHTARTAYTRSCAVNSIVGHILGIGDRHTSNILVHTKTGELVHIDFGYVFEQAKLLRTPEVVPFRLTRNVIDGMGPCGTDGVFSKSAESTLSVLRKNSDTVLTILSAIVSDPLYRWSSSPSTSDDATNEAAQRVMSKVHDKLQGFEVGTSGVHTVAGQVKFLINEARDPNNLCNMYSGWQPWV